MVAPTKKNSPAIHHGTGKTTGNGQEYARPHTMTGKNIDVNSVPESKENNAKHLLEANVSVAWNHSNVYPQPKTDGIKIRGTGAATKGLMARGPMA